MKNFSFTFLICYFFFFQINVFCKVENKIIVKVENQIISSFDIKNKIKNTLILSNLPINQDNVDKIKSQALDSLINVNLKKKELTKYSFNDDETQIINYLNSISSNNIQNLKKKFYENNLDFEIFLDEVKIELKWQKLIFSKFNNKIKIDEKSINQEVEKLLKQESEIVEYKISEIEFFSVNKAEDKNKISEIKNQINTIGFGNTALTYSVSTTASNKGNLGWINSKSLSKDFYNRINKLEVGGVSEPILNQNSYVILKLEDMRYLKKKNINKEELKIRIINRKKNDLFNLYSKSYLSKIKNTSFIEFK